MTRDDSIAIYGDARMARRKPKPEQTDAVGELPPLPQVDDVLLLAYQAAHENQCYWQGRDGFDDRWTQSKTYAALKAAVSKLHAAALPRALRPEPAEQWKQAYMEAMQMVRDAEAEIRELRAPRPESPAVVAERLYETYWDGAGVQPFAELSLASRCKWERVAIATLQSLPAGPRDASVDPDPTPLQALQQPAGGDAAAERRALPVIPQPDRGR